MISRIKSKVLLPTGKTFFYMPRLGDLWKELTYNNTIKYIVVVSVAAVTEKLCLTVGIIISYRTVRLRYLASLIHFRLTLLTVLMFFLNWLYYTLRCTISESKLNRGVANVSINWYQTVCEPVERCNVPRASPVTGPLQG